MSAEFAPIDGEAVRRVRERETARYLEEHPRSAALHARAERSLVHGVPLHWMDQYFSPFAFFLDRAEGSRLYDVDGHEYLDLGLSATAAFWGHSNEHIVAAIREQAARGSVTGFPGEDAIHVCEELARRFGLPYWQFATSATDANRFAIRLARVATGRPKVLVFADTYHGTIDETHLTLIDGRAAAVPGISTVGVDTGNAEVVPFNDLAALERALERKDVACVLTEPAITMTHSGAITFPAPGFHEGLRAATRRAGTLLIVDETQTIPAGPAGGTGLYGLEPDLVAFGKCIGGGIPAAVYGMTEEVAAAMRAYTRQEGLPVNNGGFGGTLAGGNLAVHVMRAVLERVMTAATYARTGEVCARLADGIAAVVAEHALPWTLTRLGARVSFSVGPVQTAPQQAEAHALREAIALHLANRGVLIGPVVGWLMVGPDTGLDDADRHNRLLAELVAELVDA